MRRSGVRSPSAPPFVFNHLRLPALAAVFVNRRQRISERLHPLVQPAIHLRSLGNRTINPASWGTGINVKQFTVDTATNRLGVPGGQSGSMVFDFAGNLTTDTYTSYGNRTYDAENKMTAAQDNLAGWSYYTYDADGRRTRRKIGAQETWHIYAFDSELLAEYAANAAASTPQKENGYRDGQLLVQTAGATCGAGYIGTKSCGATNGSLGHNTGQQEGTDWAAYVSSHGAGHMVYGPYDTTFGKGRHQAQFQMQVDNNSTNDVVVTLDVVTGFGTNVLAQRRSGAATSLLRIHGSGSLLISIIHVSVTWKRASTGTTTPTPSSGK